MKDARGGGGVQDPYYSRLRESQAHAADGLSSADLELLRRRAGLSETNGRYVQPDVAVSSDSAPGPHGAIPVRVYEPASTDGQRPLLVWCHGGGWVDGDLDMPEADATAREVCARAGAVVVSVDYRLAREGVHYPVPLDDVVAAWTWSLDNAPRWRATEDRAVLAGASAGGNLAAGATMRLRDRAQRLPASLALVYPALHPELPELTATDLAALDLSPSLADVLRHGLTLMAENYLGSPVRQAMADAFPALGDATGLPPTLVMTSEFDVLRLSGEAYARMLSCARVPCVLTRADGAGHGHLNTPELPAAQRSYGDLAAWVAGTFSGSPALPVTA